jgi:hypothetical protein
VTIESLDDFVIQLLNANAFLRHPVAKVADGGEVGGTGVMSVLVSTQESGKAVNVRSKRAVSEALNRPGSFNKVVQGRLGSNPFFAQVP